MLLDESSSFRSVLWGTFPENDPYFTSFGDGSPAKCFWCWRGEYPSEMVLFQHDGMTCCGFDAQKKLNNKKNSTLSWSFECGNLARFEFLGVYKCASCHVFFFCIFFSFRVKISWGFSWDPPSGFSVETVGKVGNFFVNAKRPDEIKRWRTGIHTGPQVTKGEPSPAHIRQMLGWF